jgi:HSP20 family protein
MESLAEVLEEMKEAYRRIAGGEPPMTPGGGSPFPPGVDPAILVMGEVQAVRNLSASTPGMPFGAMMPGAAPMPGATWVQGSTPSGALSSLPIAPWLPPADVWVSGSEFVVNLELAGCAKNDLHVSVASGCLDISGTRQADEGDGRAWLARERTCGPFMRRIPLPADAELGKASANLAGGMLSVRIPLGAEEPAAEGPREVQVDG